LEDPAATWLLMFGAAHRGLSKTRKRTTLEKNRHTGQGPACDQHVDVTILSVVWVKANSMIFWSLKTAAYCLHPMPCCGRIPIPRDATNTIRNRPLPVKRKKANPFGRIQGPNKALSKQRVYWHVNRRWSKFSGLLRILSGKHKNTR